MTVFSSMDALPPGTLLADCSLSGGRLEDYLRRLRTLETGPVCIVLSYTAMEFLLPCLSGEGLPLSREEALSRSHGKPLHRSEALCTGYFTEWDGETLRVVLMDTPETLAEKYRLLQRLDFPMVLVEDPALYAQLTAPPKNG